MALLRNLPGKLGALDARLPQLLGVDRLTVFFRANSSLLVFLFIAAFIAYGTDIVNFSLNIDSENHAYEYGAKGSWVAQGRWAMYLLNEWLLPDSIMPVIPILMAVTGSVIGALFFVHTLSEQRGLADYLSAALLVASPVIYFAFYFTTLGYGVGIAFAVTSIGMYQMTRWTWHGALAAAVCFCFGIGIYQAVLPLIACLFGLYVVSAAIHEKGLGIGKVLLRSLVFVLVMLLAYAMYQGLSRFLLDYYHIQFDTGYISNFTNYQLTQDYFVQALEKTWPVALDYYMGGKNYYLYDLVVLELLFGVALVVTLLRVLLAPNGWLVKLLAVLVLAAALVAPMLMHLMNNGSMPPRTVMGVSQVIAGMVFLAAASRSQFVRMVILALSIACFYKFSVATNRFAFANAMSWQADREFSVLLIQRINSVLGNKSLLKEGDPYARYPMELVGWHEYLESPIFVHREVVGASFFTWAAGDVERLERLFRTMGVSNFYAATQQQRLSVVEAAEKMPSWPDRGSVDVINGIIVIKLREYNPNQFLSMCRPPEQNNPVCIQRVPH